MNDIKEKILEEVQQARDTCEVNGTESKACVDAWDAVEELEAESSHQKDDKPKNSLEIYCDDNPEAAECRLYED